MALGDGTTWDETTPTDGTQAVQIDDYERDLRIGIRRRLANEHEWPSSQSAITEAGMHKYLTLQSQTTKPSLSGTQIAALYVKSNNNLFYEKSDGTEVTIVSGTGVGDGKVVSNSTDANSDYVINKMDAAHLTVSGTAWQASPNLINYQYYGTSHSVVATTGIKKIIVCAGIATLASGTAVISGLPFADANYGISISRSTAADVSQALQISAQSSSSFKIRDSQNTTNQVPWVAVGV